MEIGIIGKRIGSLRFKTRAMINPRGKQRVFFACHPDDFSKSFSILSNDLLKAFNCTIWYFDPKVKITGRGSHESASEELPFIFNEMQVFVFPITRKFLFEPNEARNDIFQYALDHKKPILPILMEEGLEADFDKICASIQLISRFGADPTATPYEEILDNYLNIVLISDEMAEQVKAEFKTYAFLSYRKTDRFQAQRLMRLVHDNKKYWDIAIWYDEFLVPGEYFDGAIKDAFDKSSLYILSITDHLLDPGNYVMKYEYPWARERKIKEKNLEIIPVAMHEPGGQECRVNEKALREFYEELPSILDEHRTKELNESLERALENLGLEEKEESARHSFLIGLAYLFGIDVEINIDRAFQLITAAAEAQRPYPDAMRKLAELYANGIGIDANLQKAIYWQKKYTWFISADLCQQLAPEERINLEMKLFYAMLKLSDLQKAEGEYAAAIQNVKNGLEEILRIEKEISAHDRIKGKAEALGKLGNLHKIQGKKIVAAKYCEMSLELKKLLIEKKEEMKWKKEKY